MSYNTSYFLFFFFNISATYFNFAYSPLLDIFIGHIKAFQNSIVSLLVNFHKIKKVEKNIFLSERFLICITSMM